MAIKAKTKSSALSALHEELADFLRQRLKSEDVTASDLNVVRQFLKDNGVNCDPIELQDVHNALDGLPTFDPDDTPGLYVEGDDKFN